MLKYFDWYLIGLFWIFPLTPVFKAIYNALFHGDWSKDL